MWIYDPPYKIKHSFPPQLSCVMPLGGEYPDGSASRAMWRYDPVLNTWHEMAPMNVCRWVGWADFYFTFFSPWTQSKMLFLVLYSILQIWAGAGDVGWLCLRGGWLGPVSLIFFLLLQIWAGAGDVGWLCLCCGWLGRPLPTWQHWALRPQHQHLARSVFSNLIDWLIAWNFLTFWWWLWIIFVIKVAQEIKTDMHI